MGAGLIVTMKAIKRCSQRTRGLIPEAVIPNSLEGTPSVQETEVHAPRLTTAIIDPTREGWIGRDIRP